VPLYPEEWLGLVILVIAHSLLFRAPQRASIAAGLLPIAWLTILFAVPRTIIGSCSTNVHTDPQIHMAVSLSSESLRLFCLPLFLTLTFSLCALVRRPSISFGDIGCYLPAALIAFTDALALVLFCILVFVGSAAH